jgi:amino acid transporter
MDAARSGARSGRGAAPVPVLSTRDAIALVLGIVIGAGIFRAPPVVAASAGSAAATLAVWAIGGVVSLAGAMCYAELAATYPSAGGDYHFLSRALGRGVAFLFAWARLTVIPTGALAMLAFVFGDYTAQAAGVPEAASGLAAAMVVGVTLLNIAGLRPARGVQNALAVALVLGLAVLVAAGLLVSPAAPAAPAAATAAAPAHSRELGLAMVFVLLTYGGWNEAAYVSAELRGGRRAIAAALAISLGLVTAIYILVNLAFLRGLGLDGMARSGAVASDLLSRALGPWGGRTFAVLVVAAVFTSANGTLFMGSRQIWAFGRDFPLFAPLGRWDGRAAAPATAILVEGVIALALVGFGAASRSGFEAMVAYTAPVFWLFFLLTGISLFVLRWRDPSAPRPFRVPLYPLTPLVFCASCAFLLWSSVAHAGPGAIAGLAVLATGLVPLWLSSRRAPFRRAAAA